MDGHAAGNECHEAFSDCNAERDRRSLLILMSHLEAEAGNRDARRQLEDLELAINVTQKRYNIARLTHVDTVLKLSSGPSGAGR